ncbi:NUDIX domain-containing protein [Nitrincola alkalilacustris]|uniref:NUDIX domain-containing protein n=1 Tax=Nitrincola alkalilacustris TaxID=1571224 RepID=UPI00124D5017|nr:NUDIX domain-containing protein [Nitrincola alkalilacustris]
MKNTTAGWQPSFGPDDFHTDQDSQTYKGFLNIHSLKLTHACFRGGEISVQRELLRRGDAAAVLLFDPLQDAVVLIEQFRVGALKAPAGPWLLELVAGIIEPGETPEEVAKRETLEEAGLEVHHLINITRYLPSPGGCDEWLDLLCGYVDGSKAEGIHGLAGEGEDIKVHLLSAEQAFELVNTGVINNAAAIIALQWLQLRHDEVLAEGAALMRRIDEA